MMRPDHRPGLRDGEDPRVAWSLVQSLAGVRQDRNAP
jgi:hypothetical protein